MPHELFSAIYHHYPVAWKRSVVPDTSELKSFWTEMQQHPQLQDHPMLNRSNYKTHAVPLGLHGDGVPISGIGKGWVQLLDTWNWSSLVASGCTKATYFYIWGVFQSIITKTDNEDTLDEFFKILRWSLYWLYMGVWPDRNWNNKVYSTTSIAGQRAGTYLADGYFGVLWGIMGDQDYMTKDLGLPRWNAVENPCPLCLCGRDGEYTWTDFTNTAKWLTRVWTARTWRAWPGRSKCRLFDLPGISVLTICMDYMHAKYLGLDQHQYGSIMYILCYIVLPGTPEENISVLWREIQMIYKRTKPPTRYRYLNRLRMFVRASGHPKLRGKAAEIRHFGPVLLEVWRKHMKPRLDTHRKIELMLSLNVRME